MPLPEPTNYFTLKEICNRWDCEVEYLLTANFNGLLAIIAHAKSMPYFEYDPLKLPGNTSLHSIGLKDLTRGYYFINEDVRTLSTTESLKIRELCSSYKSRDVYYLQIPRVITLSSLRISRDERNRFEKEFNVEIKTPSGSTNATTVSPNRQKNRENTLNEYLKKNSLIGGTITITQGDLWLELGKEHKALFPPTSKHTIKKFFNDQNLCTFKLGRK